MVNAPLNYLSSRLDYSVLPLHLNHRSVPLVSLPLGHSIFQRKTFSTTNSSQAWALHGVSITGRKCAVNQWGSLAISQMVHIVSADWLLSLSMDGPRILRSISLLRLPLVASKDLAFTAESAFF